MNKASESSQSLTAHLDQAVVLESSGKLSVYRMWFQDFTRETISYELEYGGFAVQSVWNDLLGTPFTADTEWIGMIAKKRGNYEHK